MSKARIKTADSENNNYTIDISGNGAGIPAQCVTKDELGVGTDVNIVDYYNKSPDEALTWGDIRLLPNTGEYVYLTDKIWKTADELWQMDAKASLAYAFMFSSEENTRWQDECPLYKTGVVTSITDEKYMRVNLSTGGNITCRTDYMSCDTAAFAENDVVIVKFENCCMNEPVVVGFWDDPKPCEYEFYIRPTFNGYSPTYGGESIKLENDEMSETAGTVVVGDFAGLCGPYTQDVDTGDEHIFLGTTVAAGVNPNYSGVNNIFAHFVEVDEEDAAYHFGYEFETLDWWGVGKKQFLIGDDIGTPILHANRVSEMRNRNILSDCAKITEEIDGINYTIYNVDFTDLYVPAQAYTLKKDLSGYQCTVCGAKEIEEPAPIDYNIPFVESITAWEIDRYDSCDGYGEECGQETDECKVFFNKGISRHALEFEMAKEQICILSDEYGKDPSYTPITINTNLYVLKQYISHPYGIGKICEVLDTDYAEETEFNYEMTFSPENKF